MTEFTETPDLEDPETSVRGALRALSDRAGGSLFVPVGETALDAHGRLDGFVREALADGEVIEARSPADERPKLNVGAPAQFYDWLYENLGAAALPGLFRRAGSLVRVPRIGEAGWIPPRAGEDGPAQVRAINAYGLEGIIMRRFWTYREKVVDYEDAATGAPRTRYTRTQVEAPRAMCQLAVDDIQEWTHVAEILGVTHTAMFRADGSLLARPGYDAESGFLHLPDTGSELYDTPDWNTPLPEGWEKWARDGLPHLLHDFPFETHRHRLNYIALLLTPLLRLVLPPPYPMWVISATQRGTGKSLLAKVARGLHGGIHRPELPPDDEEIRKQITSILTTTTAPIVNFDNVTSTIKSGQLANLLTTNIWSDRPLGRTGNVEAPNDRIWVCTGNNVQVGGDLARRVRYVRLDAERPDPERRTDFVHRDLLGYVSEKRGTLLAVLVCLVRMWVERGMPIAETRADDYARWEGALQEILFIAGLDPEREFGAVAEETEATSEDENELETLLLALVGEFAGARFTVKDIRSRCAATEAYGVQHPLKEALPAACDDKKDPWRTFGRYLNRANKTFAGDHRLVRVGDARSGAVYEIQHRRDVK